MTDLRRWNEEGATEQEQKLLDASKTERPDPAARRRAIQAVIAGAALGVPATAAGTSLSLAAKVVIGAMVVGAGGFVASVMIEARTWPPPPTPVAQPSIVPAPAQPELDEPEQEETAEPVPPVHRSVPKRNVSPSAAAPDLTEEVVSLEGVRAALARSQPDEALKLLSRYAGKFPKGKLASEATVLRVQALLAKGDLAKATALAETFVREHPDSPYAKRIDELVAEARKKN